MPWMSYRLWSGAVTGKRIRVALTGGPVAGLGQSLSALTLLPGTVGRIQTILGEKAAAPRYVKFAGYSQDLTHAAEILIERRDNPDRNWKELRNAHMDADRTAVVIRRGELDRMEIEIQ
jgi:hypothetical protein